jgi:tight adherence protein C
MSAAPQLIRWAGVLLAAFAAAQAGLWLWDQRLRRQAARRAQGLRPQRRAWPLELKAWAEEALRLPAPLQKPAAAWLSAQGAEPAQAPALALQSGLLGFGALALGLAAGLGPLALALPLLGALPWLRVYERRRIRQSALAKSLPEALDLLAAAVQAGLGLDLALQRVAAQIPAGPLRSEWQRCLDELRLGRARREAFLALEARAGLPELGGMLRAILRSEARGVPLAPVLLGLARQLRRLRSLRVQKQAAEAPVKMLLPLMGFILPVVFLILFGPILLKLSDMGF